MKQFVRILNEFQPDVVGIRSIAFFLEELQRIAGLVRAHSDATIVVGWTDCTGVQAPTF